MDRFLERCAQKANARRRDRTRWRMWGYSIGSRKRFDAPSGRSSGLAYVARSWGSSSRMMGSQLFKILVGSYFRVSSFRCSSS